MLKMQELFEKVSKDAALLKKFAEIMNDAEKAGGDATKEKLTAFAKDNGFDVTADEMKAYFADLAESKEAVLSDAELDLVAGGKVGGDQLKKIGHDAIDGYMRFPNRALNELIDFFER